MSTNRLALASAARNAVNRFSRHRSSSRGARRCASDQPDNPKPHRERPWGCCSRALGVRPVSKRNVGGSLTDRANHARPPPAAACTCHDESGNSVRQLRSGAGSKGDRSLIDKARRGLNPAGGDRRPASRGSAASFRQAGPRLVHGGELARTDGPCGSGHRGTVGARAPREL